MRRGEMGDVHGEPMSRRVTILLVALVAVGACFLGPMIPVESAYKSRMDCGEGFVLVSGLYQNPKFVCVAGHLPKVVPNE
jgi:hypothetical protein